MERNMKVGDILWCRFATNFGSKLCYACSMPIVPHCIIPLYVSIVCECAIRSFFFVLPAFVHNCFPTHMVVWCVVSHSQCTLYLYRCVICVNMARLVVCGWKSWASDNHCSIHTTPYHTSQVETTCVYSLTCCTRFSYWLYEYPSAP